LKKRCKNIFITLKKDLFRCFKKQKEQENNNEKDLKEGGGTEILTTVLFSNNTQCTLFQFHFL